MERKRKRKSYEGSDLWWIPVFHQTSSDILATMSQLAKYNARTYPLSFSLSLSPIDPSVRWPVMDEPCPLLPHVRRVVYRGSISIHDSFYAYLRPWTVNNIDKWSSVRSFSEICFKFIFRSSREISSADNEEGGGSGGGGGGDGRSLVLNKSPRRRGVNAKPFNNPAVRKISWKNEQASGGILLPVGPHCVGFTQPRLNAYRNSRVDYFPLFPLFLSFFFHSDFRGKRTELEFERSRIAKDSEFLKWLQVWTSAFRLYNSLKYERYRKR